MIRKDYDHDSLSGVLLDRAKQKRRPLSCTLELTYRCNFRCRMCYIRMTEEQAAPYGRLRTADEWIDMARQLRDAGVLYLTLTGGECTQFPGFERLYREVCRMGFRVSIMSNAGAYTDAIRALFRELPPYGAAITLYGASNETYKSVTGNPKGFDKTLESIRFFQSLGVPLKITFTMIRQNVRDYPKIGALSKELGLPYYILMDITSHNRDPAYSEALDCRLTPAEQVCLDFHGVRGVETALKNAVELEKELAHFELPG